MVPCEVISVPKRERVGRFYHTICFRVADQTHQSGRSIIQGGKWRGLNKLADRLLAHDFSLDVTISTLAYHEQSD